MFAATGPKAQRPENAFYPLTREQLEVPAIPLFRLSVDRGAAAGPVCGSPVVDRQPGTEIRVDTKRRSAQSQAPHSLDFSLAARTPIRSAAGSGSRRPQSPEVRFASPLNAEPPKFSVANEPIEKLANASDVEPREPGRSVYPYWLVALLQIVIGTALVILLIKFSELIRDTSRMPGQSRAAVEPEGGHGWPKVSLMGQASSDTRPSALALGGLSP